MRWFLLCFFFAHSYDACSVWKIKNLRGLNLWGEEEGKLKLCYMKRLQVNCVLSTSLSAPIILKQRLKTFGNYCGKFCTEEWGSDQNGRRVYGSIMLSVQFLVPLVIITFCYTAISLKLGKVRLPIIRLPVLSTEQKIVSHGGSQKNYKYMFVREVTKTWPTWGRH